MYACNAKFDGTIAKSASPFINSDKSKSVVFSIEDSKVIFSILLLSVINLLMAIDGKPSGEISVAFISSLVIELFPWLQDTINITVVITAIKFNIFFTLITSY